MALQCFKFYTFEELNAQPFLDVNVNDMTRVECKQVYNGILVCDSNNELITGLLKYKYPFSKKIFFYFVENGFQHKLDGPAHYTFNDSDSYAADYHWTLFGKKMNESTMFNEYVEFINDSHIDMYNITPEDEILIKWWIDGLRKNS